MLSMINNILLLCFISLCLGFADAGPIRARQDCAEPITVTTVHSTLTAAGPMIETCVITLTPIKNERGEDAVLEVRRCRLEPDLNNGSGAPPPPATTDVVVTETSTFATESGSSTATLATEATLSSSFTDSVATITSSVADSASATITSGTLAATTTNDAEAGAGAISVNGFTTASDFTTSASAATSSASDSTVTSTSASPSATDIAGGVVVNGPVSSIASSAVPTPASTDAAGAATPAATDTLATSAADTTSSVSAAAAEASGSATAAFALPGKKISVLPIGLGVFAGISVIALIVVGLVTYERTKYRKTFRQQKLAETGASMGYGGMAQRI